MNSRWFTTACREGLISVALLIALANPLHHPLRAGCAREYDVDGANCAPETDCAPGFDSWTRPKFLDTDESRANVWREFYGTLETATKESLPVRLAGVCCPHFAADAPSKKERCPNLV